MKPDYTPGEYCGCSARSESECFCGADWTPKEVYELREKLVAVTRELNAVNQIAKKYEDRYFASLECIKRLEEELAAMTGERDEWKQKFIQQNKDLGCEMMDPAGTIWDHAKKVQAELENLKASGIHTCHDECQRPMCVMRRQRDNLSKAAQSVVDQWDSPFWRQVEHTGVFIDYLRKAIESAKGGQQ